MSSSQAAGSQPPEKPARYLSLYSVAGYTPLMRDADKEAPPSIKPNSCQAWTFHEVETLELFVPMTIYTDQAVSFGQLLPDSLTNLQIKYTQAIQLLVYLAREAWSAPEQFSRLLIEDVRRPPPHENQRCGYRLRVILKLGQSVGDQLASLLAENAKRVQELLSKPVQPFKGEVMTPGQRLALLPIHERFSAQDYRNLVIMLHNYDLGQANTANDLDINNASSIYHPCSAFSVDQSLQSAALAGADPQQCEVRSYFQLHPDDATQRLNFAYARPELNYHVSVATISPTSYTQYRFPFAPQPHIVENKERQIFKQLHDLDSLPDSVRQLNRAYLESQLVNPSTGRKLVAEPEDIDDVFDQVLNEIPLVDSQITIDALKSKQSERNKVLSQLRLKHKSQLDNYRAMPNWSQQHLVEMDKAQTLEAAQLRRQLQIEGIREFEQLWHPQSALPQALRCIAKYFKEYLDSHRNLMSRPRLKATRNLTHFHELLALQNIDLEIVFGVNTLHSVTVGMLQSICQLYTLTKMHENWMLLGGAMTGKSFVLDLVHDFCIPGSSKKFTVATPKSKTADSDAFMCMVEIYQEVPPSQLGVVPGGGGQRSGQQRGGIQSSSTDGESIFKSVLTEGYVNLQSVVVEQGKRYPVDIKVKTNMMFLLAHNEPRHTVPVPMLTRFNAVTLPERDRTDNGGMSGANARPSVAEHKAEVIEKFRRDQMLCAIIGLWLHTGIFQPVGFEVADAIFSKLAEAGGKMHMTGFSSTRNRERYHFRMAAVAMLRAIDIVFDLQPAGDITQECAQFHETSFQWEHLLKIEKHLYSRTEDAVYVLGQQSHQYEDPIMHDVILAIKTELLQGADVEKLAQEAKRLHSSSGGESSLEGGVQVSSGFEQLQPWTGPSATVWLDDVYYHRSLFEENTYKLKFESGVMQVVARRLHSVMSPKPQVADIVDVLESLKKLRVTVTNSQGEESNVCALKLEEGSISIARVVVDQNKRGKLKQLLQDLLEHEHAAQADYLYGEPRSDVPFLWDRLSVKPCAASSKPLLKIPQASYVDPSLLDLFMSSKTFSNRHHFAKHHCTIVDQSLDDYGESIHLDRILLTLPEWREAPSSNAAKLARFVRNPGARLPKYPDDVPQNNTQRYHAQLLARERRSGESFTWSSQKLQLAQSSFVDIEPDDEPLGDEQSADDESMTDADARCESLTCSPVARSSQAEAATQSNQSTPGKLCLNPLTDEQMLQAGLSY